MRFCYADPPYPGMAHLYKDHPDYAGEVDHKALIDRLVEEFSDGWALSTHEYSLRLVLSLCPERIRVLAWCKDTTTPRGVSPWATWEPVIMSGGRLQRSGSTKAHYSCTIPTSHTALIGAKPEGFCFWLFRCLGALPGDELVDLFPGSGAVGRAWEKYQRQMRLPMERPPERQLKLG